MGKNIIAGIDVGTSAIKITVAEQKKGSHNLNVLGAAQKPSSGIRRGYVTNFNEAIKSVASVVRSVEKTIGIPVKRAYIAAGGIGLGSIKSKGTVIISRADGEISEYDVKRVISQSEANLPDISNKRIIHTLPLIFKIDNKPVIGRPLGMKGSKLEAEILFVTCLNQHLLDLIKVVESAGVAVEDIFASPIAASFAALNRRQKEIGCVLANIGSDTVSIAVFEESSPISLEVFPIGSTHITNDIALGLQIPIEEAEKLKIDYDSDKTIPRRKLSDIIEARLNDIFELIESHLKKINRNGLLPAGIILTGGGSSLLSLEDIAKASLQLPAKAGIALCQQNHYSHSISKSPQGQTFRNPEIGRAHV